MTETPFQTYSLQSLGIPEVTLDLASFRASSTQAVLTTASSVYLIFFEPLTLLTQIPNKIDAAFPSSVKHHILLCKGDKAQLLDVEEKKNVAVFPHRVVFAACNELTWLIYTDTNVWKANYDFTELQQLSKVELECEKAFYAQLTEQNQTVLAYEDGERKCMASGEVKADANFVYAHEREYGQEDLHNPMLAHYISQYDLVVAAVENEMLLIHYGETVAKVPFTDKVVAIFDNHQGFSVLTDQMVVKSFKIQMSLIEDLPVENLYQSCEITNYFNHRIGAAIISKYADYCVRNELYENAAEAVVQNEQARAYVLQQTELSENFANYAQQLMKLDRLSKQETIALANRLQQAGKTAGLLKFESKITYSEELAEFIIAENQLVDRELSKLLIRIYDEIGEFEKVARFLVKNESVKNGIQYCLLKNFAFNILELIKERELEADEEDALNIMNLKLYGDDLEGVCAFAHELGMQKEIIQFLNTFKDSALANTLKLAYMMCFSPETKRAEVEARLAIASFKSEVLPQMLVKECERYKFGCLRLLTILRYELCDYEFEDVDFDLFSQIMQDDFHLEAFSAEFVDHLIVSVHSRELAEMLLKIEPDIDFGNNQCFEEVVLYKKVFTENIIEKRQRYFEVLVNNYVLNGTFSISPFNFYFTELKIEFEEIEAFKVELTQQEEELFVTAVAKQLKSEDDMQHFFNLDLVDADVFYEQIVQEHDDEEKVQVLSLFYARLGHIKVLEQHFLKLPLALEERVVVTLAKYQYSLKANDFQHLLQYVVLKTQIKAQSETFKMLTNLLFAEDNMYDAMLVNEHLICDVMAQANFEDEKLIILALEAVKTFDQTLLDPFLRSLLNQNLTDSVRDAVIELIFALDSEVLLREVMATFSEDAYMKFATDSHKAQLLCNSALASDAVDYAILYSACEQVLFDGSEDLLLKIALKSLDSGIATALLEKVTCPLTQQHADLAESMPTVQYTIYLKSGEYLQALQLIKNKSLEFDPFRVAEQSKDIICCNYVIQEKCEQEFDKCLDIFRGINDLTTCASLIKAANSRALEVREDLAITLVASRDASQNKSYDTEICKFLGVLYEEGSAKVRPLLLKLVPLLSVDEAQSVGDQLFLLTHFKAARAFYEQAGNMKALNDCCMRVGDFAGALKSACSINSVALFEGMIAFPETRIFGLANLLGNTSALQQFCESDDTVFLEDLEVAMQLCVFANITENQKHLAANIELITQERVVDIRTDADSDFEWGRKYVLNEFCPILYSALCMLMLRSGNSRIMRILKLFHNKVPLDKIRAEARIRGAAEPEIFCSAALGDLRSAVEALIEHKNNSVQLIKLLGFCQDADLHTKAAAMLRETDPDAYFSSYLPQSWRAETLEAACAACDGSELAARLCAFIYEQKLFDVQVAAKFCYMHEPDSPHLAEFVLKCDPLPLLAMTRRRDLRVALLVRAGETRAALSECTNDEFDVLVGAACTAAKNEFSASVLEKVKDAPKFDDYLEELQNSLRLSQLVRLCAVCGPNPSIIEALARGVEKLEEKLKH